VLIVSVSAILTSCNNSETTQNNDTSIESKAYRAETTYVAFEQTDKNLEEKAEEKAENIEETIKHNKIASNLLDTIKKIIANRTEIESMDDIEHILKMRDSLVKLLNTDKEFENYMLETDAHWYLNEKFNKIGISFVSAEGIYICLDRAPLLNDFIEKLADKPFKLKTKIENLFGSLQGGEYPFTDISNEMELIPLAGKMLTEYPGYKHNKETAKMLDRALLPLVDFHSVGDDESYSYIVGNFSTDAYPGMTDINQHKRFIKEAKNSRFAPIIRSILNSPSNIGFGGDTLYYVSVPSLKSASVFADEKLNEQLKNLPEDISEMDDSFKYIWLGIDIPHNLIFSKNEKYTRAIAYRFFDRKEPALKSLATIRKIIPGARLIEHPFSEDEKRFELGR